MDSEDRRFAIKMQRNAMLSLLNASYPGWTKTLVLFHVMVDTFNDYCRPYFARDLRYLQDKGYIQRRHQMTKRDHPGVENDACEWSLTAKGNDKANDLIDDPALDLDEG
jgi:hypothetical protein